MRSTDAHRKLTGQRFELTADGVVHAVKRFWLCVLFLLTVCLIETRSVYAQANSPGGTQITRWAVITDVHVKNSGMSDLITSTLSGSGLELVEREAIDKIAEEQMVGLMATGNVGQRMRVGKLLHADALMIVKQNLDTRQGKVQQFDVTLCECRMGARLGTYTVRGALTEQTVQTICRMTSARARQFSNGVRSIVAIAPFACLNINHDYDTLAESFSGAIVKRLLTLDGVAVLEFEEAREIAKEFSGGELADSRNVPLFVSPTFRVVNRDSRSIDFDIQIRSGANVSSVKTSGKSVTESPGWLEDVLIPEILRQLGAASNSLSLEEQRTRLSEQADRHARLGDLRGSIECREALLLVDRLNVEQRVALLEELNTLTYYDKVIFSVKPENYKAELETPLASRARCLDHLAFLIEGRLINRSKAIEQLRAIRLNCVNAIHVDGLLYSRLDTTGRTIVDASLASDRYFMLKIAPKILELEDSQNSTAAQRLKQETLWFMTVMDSVFRDVNMHACNEDSFNYFMRVIQETIPESALTKGAVIAHLRKSLQEYYIRPDEPTANFPNENTPRIGPDPATVARYVELMRASNHKHLRWYGAMFELDQNNPKRMNLATRERIEELTAWSLQRLSALIDEMSAEPHRLEKNEYGNSVDAILGAALGMRSSLVEESRQPTVAPVSPSEPPRYLSGDFKDFELDRIKITRLDINVPIHALYPEWLAADPSHDVFIGSDGVYVMSTPGKWTAIRHVDSGPATGCWDGLHVWSAAPGNDVQLHDLQGQLALRISESDGLPPHDRHIRLFPLEANRVLACGVHGREEGCWVAIVTAHGSVGKVDVIHEARRRVELGSVSNEKRMELNADIETSFSPHWAARVHDAKRDLVYLGRRGYQPLEVDLSTRKIRVSDAFARTYYDGGMRTSLPTIFKYYPGGVALMELPADGKSIRMVNERFIVNELERSWSDQYPALIQDGDWFVKPGIIWHRMKSDGSQVETLVTKPLPNNFHQLYYGYSSHYGFVGYGSSVKGAYQFKIK